MGNQYALTLLERARDYLDDLGHPTVAATRLFQEFERDKTISTMEDL